MKYAKSLLQIPVHLRTLQTIDITLSHNVHPCLLNSLYYVSLQERQNPVQMAKLDN